MYSLLYLVPKNWLSRLVGWSVRRSWPMGFHKTIRDTFIRVFKVDMQEAEKPIQEYGTLGDFFIRKLKPGSRPIGAADLVSPVDGLLTQRGFFGADLKPQLTQIKGITYSLAEFLGSGWNPSPYNGGSFFTIYLAPWNYHRIHSPASSHILRARHIAGMLWPVNSWSVENIPNLFVRNDRILVEMESDLGLLMVCMVGATNVGRISLSFESPLRGNTSSGIRDWKPPKPLYMEKGQDMACFEMGSTVVVILDSRWTSRLNRSKLGEGSIPIQVGAELSK